MNEDQTPKDEGSVWASYSDLFTNVAIIFLVMFVFALLKSGISKMETAMVKKRHSEELKGKLTEKDVAKSKEKIKKVEDSIVEMQKVENLVDDKIREMQNFAKSMEQNKVVLKELIEEQKKKDSLLNTVNESITKKEIVIKELEAETEMLDKNIKALEDQKIVLEGTLKQKDQISQKDQTRIAELEKEIKKQADVKTQRHEEIQSLKKLVTNGQVTIENLEKQNQELADKIKSSELLTQGLKTHKDHLEARIHELQMSKSKMEKSVADLQQQVKNQQTGQSQLMSQLTQSEASQKAMREAYDKLNKTLDGKMAEINHLKSLNDKSMAQTGSLEDQLRNTQDKMRNLGKALQEMKGKLRSTVADSLKRKFTQQQMNVLVDSETGNITLLMNDNFLFKRNSHELSEKAQQTLSKIAPIYAEVIFGDEQISSKIENIEIIGHASPSFKKSYVDPQSESPEAYGHNMRLSAQRAASIANFMMGRNIGNYHFKNKMRESLFAVGRSYISPIEKAKTVGRDLASVDDTCGPYDCSLSQRVEISFRLKDDMKAIEKLINMAGAK